MVEDDYEDKPKKKDGDIFGMSFGQAGLLLGGIALAGTLVLGAQLFKPNLDQMVNAQRAQQLAAAQAQQQAMQAQAQQMQQQPQQQQLPEQTLDMTQEQGHPKKKGVKEVEDRLVTEAEMMMPDGENKPQRNYVGISV